MDEFGAALRRTSELRSRKRMDAPAASVSQYRYPLANASEFARGHQACGTGSDDDDMVCVLFGHAGSFTGVSCDRPSHCCIMGRGYCTPGQLRD